MEAAEIMGVTDRTMRRWKRKHEQHGYVLDRRWGRKSEKKVSVEVIERVLGLCRDQYFDLSVSHFHEKLAAEHDIRLSYSWVKRRCKPRAWWPRHAIGVTSAARSSPR